MGDVTLASTIRVEPFAFRRADNLSDNLLAGEAINAGATLRIDGDGKVYEAVTTEAQNTQTYEITVGTAPDVKLTFDLELGVSDFIGYAPKDFAAGDPVDIMGRGSKIRLADGTLTPGGYLFVSATKGETADAVVLAGDLPIAVAIDDSNILVIR